MCPYPPTETHRWKNILYLLRCIPETRVNSAVSALDRESERSRSFRLSLLRERYEDSRFLCKFPGCHSLTRPEQQAAELLKELPAPTGPQSP